MRNFKELRESVATTYVVVYRVGGTDRFEWRRTLAMTYDEALQTRLDLLRQGYHALYPVEYNRSMSIGLPDTYYPPSELKAAEGKKVTENKQDWRYEVANDDTRLGYDDWQASQRGEPINGAPVDWSLNDSTFPVADWKYEVANDDTRLGYAEWLQHKIEAQ